MLSIDAKDFNSSIDKYKEELTKGLEKAVKQWVMQILKGIISETPYGDSRAFSAWYLMRHEVDLMYPLEEGMLRTNWNVSVGFPDYDVDYRSDSFNADKALSEGLSSLRSYHLGETIYITNNTPYLDYVRSPQSPGGVKNHLASVIRNIYTATASFKDNVIQ